MTEEEAEAFLQDYQETEEPRGLLNLVPRKPNAREVEKDW